MNTKLDYVSKNQFLALVQELVASRHVTVAELVAAGTRALEERCDKINVQRCEAETALLMVIDLVPEAKQKKHSAAMIRAKKVLIESGAYSGTVYTDRLKEEIMTKEEK